MTTSFSVQGQNIGEEYPTYFIADIAANHDGDLQRAKDLIFLAAEAGADAAKFQHFEADKIVSDYGFRDLKQQQSHQAKWEKSVFEVYEDASVPRDWTTELQETCQQAGIHFFSAPYDFEAVDLLETVGVPAHKIGSGDITWTDMLERISASGKPVFIATGASDMLDVMRAMDILTANGQPVCLMQCNTNYTGTLENLQHIHLNVLKTYATMWPDIVLGLSDHTPGHATVLGAVALGARAIEKHFTDDKSRVGPDHAFSMDPAEWRDMVERTRELEAALGSPRKFVADNESQTVVLQRRCLRAARDLQVGEVLQVTDIEALRPAPADAVMPYDASKIVGRTVRHDKTAGEHLTFFDVE
ncbi:MAG: N-acetylneuraminate synthase family protein [Chromatiales bacterium]|jgi:N-acetylneuraminate synthase